MTASLSHSKPLPKARLAGLLYLAVIVCGVGGEGLVRGQLFVHGDVTQTAVNLREAALAFRLSIVADVVMALCDVALAVLLYALLEPVNQLLSRMAMAFRLVQAAILGANLVNLEQAITLASAPTEASQLSVTRLLQAHAAGYDFGLFFFGINCLLMARLIIRSTFVPSALGWMLTAAAVVYLAGSTLRVLAPAALDVFAPAYAIPLLAELAFCVWLLVRARADA